MKQITKQKTRKRKQTLDDLVEKYSEKKSLTILDKGMIEVFLLPIYKGYLPL
jgi:hypothetical protein